MIGERTVVNGCYILIARIGGDEFSEWWRASAIFVASNFLLRFLKEGYTIDDKKIRHFIEGGRVRSHVVSPAVIEILEIDRFDSRFFIASEFGAYRQLASVLTRGMKFTLEHSCRLVIELAEGVDAFHQRGIMFESLNPESIVVSESGGNIDEIKVLSPGYGPLLTMIPESDEGSYRDYWAYAAPELKRGVEADPRADIYSLGIILFRLITGKLPYGSKAGVKVRHNSASPSHVARALARRGLPMDLATVVVKALRKRASMRYDSAIDFIDDLHAVLDSRRSKTMQEGGLDPIAALASLNLKRAKADAREIVRSLETTDYFRLLKSDVSSVPLTSAQDSPTWHSEDEEDVSSLEDFEAQEDDDDEDVSTAQYVYAGYGIAAPKATIISEEEDASVGPPREVEASPREASPKEASPKEASPKEASPKEASPKEASPKIAKLSIDASIQPIAPVQGTGIARGSADREAALRWKQVRGSATEVADAILLSAKLAMAGTGTVKFIEEPVNRISESLIEETFITLSGDSLLIDIGYLREDAGVEDIRREIERRLGLVGLASPFESIVQDDTPRRSPRYRAQRDARTFCRLSSKDRPLIFVARHVERISLPAHHFLMEYSRLAVASSACGFFFFGDGSVPRWHILRSLE